MTLREALLSNRWFERRGWEKMFEPFAFRGRDVRLECAPRNALCNTKISERCFEPFDVICNDWELVDER